jgi:hypothetical protein
MKGQAVPNGGPALAVFKRWIKRGPRLGMNNWPTRC